MKQRNIRKLAAVLMLVSFIFGTVSPAMAAGIATFDDMKTSKGNNDLTKASTIYYGSYWQSAASGYAPNGTSTDPEEFNANNWNKDAIKWRVLANNPEADIRGNKGLFLLSDQPLYAKLFNPETVPVAIRNIWGKDESTPGAGDGISSELRTTTNNTTPTTFNLDGTVATWGGFAGDAFSTKEYAAIATASHKLGGNATGKDYISTEKIFPLAYDELGILYGVTYASRATDATQMAKSVNVYGNTVGAIGTWFLRSPGRSDTGLAMVYANGESNDSVGFSGGRPAMRPALNLDKDKVLFLSAATGGKGNVNVGNGFTLADNTTNEWKLTLLDAYSIANTGGIKKPTIAAGDVTFTKINPSDEAQTALASGKTAFDWDGGDAGMTINYSGATTGTNMYVSALLYDSTGTDMLNYAKIAETDTAVKATGTATTTLANLAEGTYKTTFFSEQANGDCQTDYGGELTDQYSFVIGNTLGKAYNASGLTANVSNGAKLVFEDGEYNTGVTVAAGETGCITADVTSGTILTGNLDIDGTLTTANSFTFTGEENKIGGTLTGDALTIAGGTTTVGSTGSIENDVTIQTAGTVKAEGRMANATVSTGGTLELNADKYGVTGGVADPTLDGGTVKFTGGTLTQAITGTGTTEIAGEVTANAAIGNNVEIADGKKLTLGADVTGTILVGTNASLYTSANYLKNTVTNNSDNSVHLTGGTLEHNITGTGTTYIDSGEVTNNAEIENSVNILNGATLSTNASKIATGAGETITNAGTLQFTAGTLAKDVANSGDITAKNGVAINSVITGTGTTTLETGASFGTDGKITGGDVTLNGNSFISSNLGTVADLTSNEAIYNFNANV
ncbi:MAG: hypothetical protein KBS54_07540, partial [Synergistaceae bacterium]|nr:hypothetical protein [Candidatus Equadaptatus faecalis]